ncbi:hypothetical protein ACWDSJ_26365 [Nocardia sp. NPDC003482]
MADTNAFYDAVLDLHLDFPRDPRTARDAFRAALALATPDDHAFLDTVVETFTLYPFRSALRRLEAAFAGDPAHSHLLVNLVADTDPGLYVADRADRVAVLEDRARRNNTSVEDEAFAEHVSLAVTESPRVPMRQWRTPPARLYAPPSRETDKSRLQPEQIARRVRARAKRRPVSPEPRVVTAYVADSLYVDTMARELADGQAAEDRMLERGLIQPGEPTPPVRGEQRRVDSQEARSIWDHEFVGYVAEQHHHALALAGERPLSEDNALAYADRRTTVRGDRPSASRAFFPTYLPSSRHTSISRIEPTHYIPASLPPSLLRPYRTSRPLASQVTI